MRTSLSSTSYEHCSLDIGQLLDTSFADMSQHQFDKLDMQNNKGKISDVINVRNKEVEKVKAA